VRRGVIKVIRKDKEGGKKWEGEKRVEGIIRN